MPKFRFGTKKAIESLAHDLNMPYDQNMQDWSYEVADPKDIEKYIEHYRLISDEDEKFVLMEIIIQATNDQVEGSDSLKYWDITKGLLTDDFKIHEYTIFYWSCFDSEDTENTWTITPKMRDVWNDYFGT